MTDTVEPQSGPLCVKCDYCGEFLSDSNGPVSGTAETLETLLYAAGWIVDHFYACEHCGEGGGSSHFCPACKERCGR